MLIASGRNNRKTFVFFIPYHPSENYGNIGFDSSILKGTAFCISVLELIYLEHSYGILAMATIYSFAPQ